MSSRCLNVLSSFVLNPQLDESQPDFSLTFRHRLRDGATPLTHYGALFCLAFRSFKCPKED